MKEYLLLRNNKESGPYSLDELKQLGLKAYDLVWIENKSYSWKYPSEVSELEMFVPSVEMLVSENSAVNLNETWREELSDGSVEKNWFSGGSIPTAAVQPESYKTQGHIVTLRPRIENIQIKTIKSVAQPNIVKVEVRDNGSLKESVMEMSGSAPEPATTLPQQHAVYSNTSLPPKDYRHRQLRLNLPESLRMLSDNNKLELIVLAIATASLLAVAYLLITAGY